MTSLEWLGVAVAAILFWIVSGWIVRMAGVFARLAVRMVVFLALMGLAVYVFWK